MIMLKPVENLTISEARAYLDSGKLTAVELTRACLDRIKQVDGKLHACLLVCENEAMRQAEAADRRLGGAGKKLNPPAPFRKEGIKSNANGALLGIPYLVKDNIMTKGVRTTAGSKILENYLPPYNATVVKKLNAAGAVCLGKTNLDEFAHGASTEFSAFAPTKNPWDQKRAPGGSSGGSAAAVSVGLCLFALGTDTGGSVRHPAAFCGVVGLKPTYGLCSRFGLIAMTSSTDVPGVLCKTAADVAAVLQVLVGQDELDSTAVKMKLTNYADELVKLSASRQMKKITIGVPAEYFIKGLSRGVEKKVRDAIDALERLGAIIKSVSLPHTQYGVAVYYLITCSEISANLARFDGLRYGWSKAKTKDLLTYYLQTRGLGFGQEVKRRIMLGTYALSAGYHDAYYLQAQKVRTKIIEDFGRVFKEVDLLVTPTTPQTAFKLGEQSQDPLQMYLEDIFLTPASLAGLPAISLPCGLSEGLPVGMQLIGQKFSENLLLTVADIYGRVTKRLQPQI